MRSLFRSLLCLALIHFSPAVLFGEDIPLRNWPIPTSLQKEGGGPVGTGVIRNGTYHADGTVNMETAKRLGWDKKWKKREAAPSK